MRVGVGVQHPLEDLPDERHEDVEGDAVDGDELRSWLDAVAERCPVADDLANDTDLAVTVERA